MTFAPLTSGSLALKSAALLSPMEGVSDVGFRALCFANGAGITYTEMIRARGITKHNKSTLDLIDTFDSRTLTGLQLLVTKPEELIAAVAILEDLAGTTHLHFKNIVTIDLNFGCPSPDVVRIGAGPALLKRRAKLHAIFEALAHIKKTSTLGLKSVSAKIRLGLNQQEQDHKVYLPVVEMANATLDHLVVHARHAKQRSRDAPTWSAIGEAKAHARIPIIGNGDVRSLADAERMRTETGCDGVMIARAAIRDPWMFRAFVADSAAPVSAAELGAAELAYTETAQRFHSKEKFVLFHRDNFARIRSGAGADVAIPRNAHIS